MSSRKRRRKSARPEGERAALLVELEALYADIDARYADHRCESTTECCRFAVTGRTPYVTGIELALVERAIAARGGPLAKKRRALPLVRNRSEGICPLLDEDARCAIYAARPLGCRTHFCHRVTADAPVKQRELNAFVARLKDLAERYAAQHGGDAVGRPLTRSVG